MAADFLNDTDFAAIDDDLLLKHDEGLSRMDDFSSLLDIESSLTTDELFNSISNDLEIPMMHDTVGSGNILDQMEDPWNTFSDSSDSGVESLPHVKQEPLSPVSSHCSESSLESNTQSLLMQEPILMDFSQSPLEDIKLEAPPSLGGGHFEMPFLLPGSDENTRFIKIETPDTPPQTPPMDNCSILSPCITMVTEGSNTTSITTLPITTATSILLPNGTTAKGGVKIVMPQVKTAVPRIVTQVRSAQAITEAGDNVSRVISNKVKIQPRPIVGSALPTKPGTPQIPQGKALVLTPDEFAKLTSQGVLKFTPPASGAPTTATLQKKGLSAVTRPSPVITSLSSGIPSVTSYSHIQRPCPLSPLPIGGVHADADMKVMKRQQRMIKNRESACLSRKRKKEYLSNLEYHLKDYTDENTKLRHENNNLKRKVEHLQQENIRLKQVLPGTAGLSGGPSKKATTLLLGVLLLLSLNLGPLLSIVSRNNGISSDSTHLRRSPSEGAAHHSRNLLAFDYTDYDQLQNYRSLEETINQLRRTLDTQKNDKSGSSHFKNELLLLKKAEEVLGSSSQFHMCPTYFNSTESMKLLNDLRGWVQGHEDARKRTKEKQAGKKAPGHKDGSEGRKKVYYPPRRLKAAMKGVGGTIESYASSDGSSVYEVQVFNGADQQYSDLLTAINRRNDTLYVVSFRRDHVLLPATAHNKTSRPRMSLVMPAMGVNETMQSADGSIAMMQIDCEVTGTKLVHLSKADIPTRDPLNHTGQDSRSQHRGSADRQHWSSENKPQIPDPLGNQ